jgi:hypothetical protein
MQFLSCRCAIAAAALAFVLHPPGVAAATVEPVKRPYCNVRLDGPIEQGDLKKILAAIEKSNKAQPRPENDLVGGTSNVCLNSNGGSLPEALRIIDHFSAHLDIGTVVDRGDACHSVCAFIFMGGRFNVFHAITSPVRRLHVDGVLGFRTPPFKAEQGAHDKTDLQKAYAEGARAVSELVVRDGSNRSFSDKDRILPRTLMLELLGREPDQPLLIETVNQAGRWNIELIGFRQPAELTSRMLLQACANRSNWSDQKRIAADGSPATDAAVKLDAGKFRTTFEKLGPGRDISCVADVFKSAERGYFIAVQLGGDEGTSSVPEIDFLKEQVTTSSDFGKVGLSPGVALWSIFPPETRIRDLGDR